VELRGLRECGCRVSVSTFRARPPGAERLLGEHDLRDVDISYGGTLKWLIGAWGLILRPAAAVRLLTRGLRGTGRRPGQALVALALLPRAFGIALELEKSRPEHVHIFWGHYPSLVGHALKVIDETFPVSIFLGAYDLVTRFPPSARLAREVPVMTHSKANLEAIRDFTGVSPEKVSVAYRGIRVGSVQSGARGEIAPRIVMVERLIAGKRTVDGIEVFARVAEHVPGARLIILGDGPNRPDLERMIRDRGLDDSVALRGHVSHEIVLEELEQAALFLSMSRSPSERIPNAAKEAMSVGCPVVAGRTPGIDELVLNGDDGYIVSAGDVEEAATRVKELLRDHAMRERMGRSAREHVDTVFNIEATTRQRLAFWGFGTSRERAQPE